MESIRPPKLPSASSLLYPNGNVPQWRNEPGKHQQRKRKIPHIEGNFATVVYIPIRPSEALSECAQRCSSTLRHIIARQKNVDSLSQPLDEESEGLIVDAGQSLQKKAKRAFPEALCNNRSKYCRFCSSAFDDDEVHCELLSSKTDQLVGTNKALLSTHVSLSKTLILRQHFIEKFISKLREALKAFSRFYLDFSDRVDVYANENYDRFFAAQTVSNSCRDLKVSPLIDSINRIVKDFGLPEYYKSRSPHVSLAWTLQDIRPALQRLGAPVGFPNSSLLNTPAETTTQEAEESTTWLGVDEVLMASVARESIQRFDGPSLQPHDAPHVATADQRSRESSPQRSSRKDEHEENTIGKASKHLELICDVKRVYVRVGEKVTKISLGREEAETFAYSECDSDSSPE